MAHIIEERYYFVTYGLTTGKAIIYLKGDVQARYSLAIFFLGLFFTYLLLRDMSERSWGFVTVMSAVLFSLLYLSFRSGRSGAREYIKEHQLELLVEKR